MTPEEAQELLNGTTPAPWEVELRSYEEPAYPEELVEFWITSHNGECIAHNYDIPGQHAQEIDSNYTLMAAAPGMAAMIAGMTTEYAIEHQTAPGAPWQQVTKWSTEHPLKPGHRLYSDTRIVKRYVTAPQPLGGEEQ